MPQRRTFSIIDGVIGGESNGPLAPDPVAAGVLLAGENLVAVDLVAARLMGFDPLKIRMYQNLLTEPEFDFGVRHLDDIQVDADPALWKDCLSDQTRPLFGLQAPSRLDWASGSGRRVSGLKKPVQFLSEGYQRTLDRRTMDERISLVGLGKLGLCLAASYAERGFDVFGVDHGRKRCEQSESGQGALV